MDYAKWLKERTILPDRPVDQVQEKIDKLWLEGSLTEEERDELRALADQICDHTGELPPDEERLTNLEKRAAEHEHYFVLLGMMPDEEWPLVTGNRFESADQAKHTGDKVAMKLPEEQTVRHYVCKLNPKYEEKGTLFTPAGNAASWKEFPVDADESTISDWLVTWRAKFPDFHSWVNYPETAEQEPTNQEPANQGSTTQTPTDQNMTTEG